MSTAKAVGTVILAVGSLSLKVRAQQTTAPCDTQTQDSATVQRADNISPLAGMLARKLSKKKASAGPCPVEQQVAQQDPASGQQPNNGGRQAAVLQNTEGPQWEEIGNLGMSDTGYIDGGPIAFSWNKIYTETPEIMVSGITPTGGSDPAGWDGSDKDGNRFVSVGEGMEHGPKAWKISGKGKNITVTEIDPKQVPKHLDDSWAGVKVPDPDYGPSADPGRGSPITPLDDSAKHATLSVADQDSRIVTLIAGNPKVSGTTVWKDDASGDTFMVNKSFRVVKVTKVPSTTGSRWKDPDGDITSIPGSTVKAK